MTYTPWAAVDAVSSIAVPTESDDKYSRGVLGVVTGSKRYPGAAVLGVEAAMRTGVGMVRYLGPDSVARLVMQRRPEIVTADGRVQAWLIGSGMDAAARTKGERSRLVDALAQDVPIVIDAGALDLLDRARGTVVITPHARELARVLDEAPETILDDPASAASRACETLGVTVLLKGHRTHVAGTDGTRLVVGAAPAWLATAGSGDTLGGILGALLATHAGELAADASLVPRLAASAAVLHGLAATRASGGGPIAALDVAEALPAVIAALLR